MDSDFPRLAIFAERYCRHVKGPLTGQPVRFEDWLADDLMLALEIDERSGLRSFQDVFLSYSKKHSKDLWVGTPILTGGGWRSMGELSVGDKVFGADGALCSVTDVSEVFTDNDCYRIEFTTGEAIIAGAGHEWVVNDLYNDNKPRKATTEYLYTRGVFTSQNAKRWSIDKRGIVEFPSRVQPLDPYVVGYWLGDGDKYSAQITFGAGDESHIRRAFASRGLYLGASRVDRRTGAVTMTFSNVEVGSRRGGSAREALRMMGMVENKHIPEAYLFGDAQQRMELLCGLMDSDGTVATGHGYPRCVFNNTNRALADGVLFLARSLGWKPTIREYVAKMNGKNKGAVYEVSWTAYRDRAPFLLERKIDKLIDRPNKTLASERVHIARIVPTVTVPTVCISVDHPSHMFLAGATLIPTHNTLTTTTVGLFELSPFQYPVGGPENVSLAGTKDQARLALDPARTMLNPQSKAYSPRLAELFSSFRNTIVCRRNDGLWTVLPHNADNVEGINPTFGSCDEYATHKSQTLRDNVRTAMIAREQPLMLTISTKGDSTDRPMYKLEKEMLKHPKIRWVSEYKWIVADREAGLLYVSCGLPEDFNGDYEDPAVWEAVNMASWVTTDALSKTWHNPSVSEAAFRRKHLNQWVPSALESGITPEEWDACRVEGARIPDGTEVWTMADLGFTDDWSAYLRCGWVDGRLVLESELWEPPDDGGEIDVRATVDQAAMDTAEQFQLVRCGADPWNAKLLMQDWYYRGWPVEEVKMRNEVMVPASSMFLEAVRRGTIAHNGDERLRWHILNMRKKDTEQGWRFVKPDDPNLKIDGGIAAVGAVYLALSMGLSALEQHGIFV